MDELNREMTIDEWIKESVIETLDFIEAREHSPREAALICGLVVAALAPKIETAHGVIDLAYAFRSQHESESEVAG